MLTLATVLAALPTLMNAAREAPEVIKLVGEIVGSFHARPEEQDRIKAEIATLADENDPGHAELQRRLAEAAAR